MVLETIDHSLSLQAIIWGVIIAGIIKNAMPVIKSLIENKNKK